MLKHALTLAFITLAGAVWAGEARVVDARLTQIGTSWRADVTVAHADTGWDHYADGWDVRSMDGTELGYRKLHHPHVTEQPFTRSLSGITIPDGTTEVRVRAHDSVHGWGPDVIVSVE